MNNDLILDRERADEFLRSICACEGWWAATPRSRLARKPRWFDDFDEFREFLAGDGWGLLDYFVPSPFVSRSRTYESLSEVVSVVRVDVDPPAVEGAAEFVTEKLGDLHRIVGAPSAVVDSGRGAWAYYVLGKSIPKAEARLLNKALAVVSGSEDIGSYNPASWVRLPGSTNEKTGNVARIVDLDPERVYEPDSIRDVLGDVVVEASNRVSRSGMTRKLTWDPGELTALELPPDPVFSQAVSRYIGVCPPTTSESQAAFGKKRHQMEQQIFVNLAGHGWTTEQIHAFAYQKGLPRYMEEFGNSWADDSIVKARAWVDEHPLDLREDDTTPPSIENRKKTVPPSSEDGGEGTRKRQKRLSNLAHELLKEIDGSRPGEIYDRLAVKHLGKQGFTDRNLRRKVDDPLIKYGYVVREKGEDGVDRLVRTKQGDKTARSQFTPELLRAYRYSLEGWESKKAALQRLREKRRAERHPRQVTSLGGNKERRIGRNRYRSDFDGRLRLSFNGKKSVFYIQLLTPVEDLTRLDLYSRIHTGFDAAGHPTYAEAVAYKDEGSRDTGVDPMAHRELSRNSWDCVLGVGALLDVTDEGFSLSTTVSADGEIVPAVGLLVEDTQAFWWPLLDVENFDRSVLRMKRRGPWGSHWFEFIAAGEAIDLSAVPRPDLTEYLDEISEPGRLAAILEQIPEYRPLGYYPG